MKASNVAIELIKKYEGCRLGAYRCPAGIWTIGYGHTLGVRSGDTITKDQAEEYLMQDVEKYETMVNAYNDKYNWSQNEFDALVSFAFNIGNIRGLTQMGSRSKGQIADAMLLYVKAKGTTLPGLVKRRNEEHEVFTCSDPLYAIALDVIAGKYGNGAARTKALKKLEVDPKSVQKIVNDILCK